jgi:MerR family transcriptional regulator, light-induced transcriptional regulator
VSSFEGGGSPGIDQASLPVGEVARRTGVSVSDLRNWESRYGFPRPTRSDGGQRRYREADCALIQEIDRRRRSGLSVGTAIRAVLAEPNTERDVSLFATTCRRHPGLKPQTLTKRVLLALTWAIEDHINAVAEPMVLIGSFQEPTFYRRSAPRWHDLAETAEYTIVFGAPDARRLPGGTLVEVPIPDQSPLRQEWALVCDGPEAACVLARERPGQSRERDADRLFETVWSIDPFVVRSASTLAIALVPGEIPAPVSDRLSVPPPAAHPEVRTLDALVHRTLGYLAGISGSSVSPDTAEIRRNNTRAYKSRSRPDS